MIRLFLVALFAASVSAQDFVQLTDGRKLRGEVIKRDDTETWLVTPDAVLEKLASKDVASIRNAQKLPAGVVDRLGEDGLDPKHVYAVAEWVAKDPKRKRIAQRLLRRCVALKPDFEPAREALGHVLFERTWYTERKAAYNASKAKMKADGFVYYRGGWIKKEMLSFLKSSFPEWMRYRGLTWRLITEVRQERGDKLWLREWYVGRETKLVRSLKSVWESAQEDIHGADVGRCRVFGAFDRDEVRAIATRHQKASDWFATTFHLAERDRRLITAPRLDDYIFSGPESFIRFLEKNRRRFGLDSPEAWALAKQTESQSKGNLFVQHAGRPAWEWGAVSCVGTRLIRRLWAGGDPPAWIWVATGHHAEIAVMGDVRVQWVKTETYGRKTKVPELEGRNMDELKAALREVFAGSPLPGLRVLMNKELNDLDASLDLLGTCYLAFLLEEHRETWLDFCTRTKGHGKDIAKRFEAHFKMTYEACDQLFKKWLG